MKKLFILIGILGIFTDITAKEQKKQKLKLENGSKKAFIIEFSKDERYIIKKGGSYTLTNPEYPIGFSLHKDNKKQSFIAGYTIQKLKDANTITLEIIKPGKSKTGSYMVAPKKSYLDVTIQK